MNCKDCRYWDKFDRKYKSALNSVGVCNRAMQWWDATEWSLGGEDVLKEEAKERKMFVQDGSDYHATLYTTPDFGCIEFKKNEGESNE